MEKSVTEASRNNMIMSLIMIGALFFIFGFVTWLNGILITYLQIACELTNFQAVFVAFAFYISYTLMALPSSRILEKTGFKLGMMLGLMIMAMGTLIFIPAALMRTYTLFLAGLFVMGTGLALLQTAVNPYVTILGKRETAAVRLSIMGICNNLAGAIGPLILAYYILDDGDAFVRNLKTMDEAGRLLALNGLARRVIGPYIVMTLAMIIMGVLVRFSKLPEIDEEKKELQDSIHIGRTHILQYPHLVLGVISLFFYVGVEVIAGNTIMGYGLALGVPIDSAKTYTTMVMIAMLIGYVVGIILIPKILSFRQVLAVSALLGISFSLAALLLPSGLEMTMPLADIRLPYTVLFIALLGFANAMIWPSIWPLAIHGLGRFISQGSALMIMAIAGGAVMPLLWGYLSDVWSARQAYWITVPSYLIILFYVLWGYKVKHWNRNA